MGRKSKLQVELEKYSPMIEDLFINQKFKFDLKPSPYTWTSKEETLRSGIRRFYNSIDNKIAYQLGTYKPNYETRHNAINRCTAATQIKILQQLTDSSKDTKGKRGDSKVSLDSFF